jgi:uncharacterized protein YndB with AHSA1/START domain
VAASKISPNAGEIVSEIHIAAQPGRVFQALVDSEQVVQWWGQGGVYLCTQFNADLRIGGRWRSAGVGPDGTSFEVTGEYLEIDPPRLLVYTWIASWTGDVKTKVRWELEPTKQGTLVKIVIAALRPTPSWQTAIEAGRECWDGCRPFWKAAKLPTAASQSPQPDNAAGAALIEFGRVLCVPCAFHQGGLPSPRLSLSVANPSPSHPI